MPHVVLLSTTSVKGTALHHPEALELSLNGVAENRHFFLIDSAGRMVNGKRFGSVVQIRAEYDRQAQTLSLTHPSGETITEPVILSGERTSTDFYGRPVPGEVVSGAFSKFFSDYCGEPMRLVQADQPGAGVDVHPVTLISTATVDEIRDRSGAPVERWRDRFRITVEVDGLQPFAEERWEGATIAVGDAVLAVAGPVPRCIVTTQNPRTGERDFETLAALHRLRGERRGDLATPTKHLPDGGRLVLGVYAVVARPGSVRIGDVVRLAGGVS